MAILRYNHRNKYLYLQNRLYDVSNLSRLATLLLVVFLKESNTQSDDKRQLHSHLKCRSDAWLMMLLSHQPLDICTSCSLWLFYSQARHTGQHRKCFSCYWTQLILIQLYLMNANWYMSSISRCTHKIEFREQLEITCRDTYKFKSIDWRNQLCVMLDLMPPNNIKYVSEYVAWPLHPRKCDMAT